MTSEASELLAALIEHPEMSHQLKDRLARVSRLETTVIMDRLLEHTRKEQEWGVPPILNACITLAEADPIQGPRLAAFLAERPPQQIQPNIVPKISARPWSRTVLDAWSSSPDVMQAVKTAIKKTR